MNLNTIKILLLALLLPLVGANTMAKSQKVWYQLEGKGTRTIVLLHGACINSSYWSNQVAHLKDKYMILTIDHAGHGKSKDMSGPYTLERFANDAVGIIKSLKLDSIILVGHSMSGDISLHIHHALKGKVLGIIGIDNFKGLGAEMPPEQKKQMDGFMKLIDKDFAGSIPMATSFLFSSTTDTAVKARVNNDVLEGGKTLFLSILKSIGKQSAFERSEAKQLKVPLFLVNSDKDPTDESLLKKYCGASYKIWQIHNSGHYPMIEQPTEFNRLLDEALASIK